jgi:hypothetical protein
MKEPYLEVTYWRGRAVAAYYYLPRRPGQKSVRTRRAEQGLVIDLARGGQPIGIEITAPSKVSLASLNRLLRELGFTSLTREDLAPLLAA